MRLIASRSMKWSFSMSSESAALATRPVDSRLLGRHYAALQGIYWANIASTAVYSVVLLQSRGITNTQIGVIMAFRALASIILQPFTASLADRLQQRIPLKYFGIIMILIAFSANLALYFSGGGFVALVIIFMVMGASENVMAPINDALAIQYINGGYPLNYSVARGIGSLSFAVSCLVLAGLVGRAGVESTIILHGILLLLLALVLITFRNYPGPISKEYEKARPKTGQRMTYRQILAKNPAMLVFLTAAFCLMVGASSVFQYLPNFISRAGGSSSDVGIALFVLAAAQFPTSLIYRRIARRFNTSTLLLVAYFFIFIRCLLVMLAGHPELIIAVMALDLFGGGLQISSEVFFINEIVGSANVVKGQSLIRIIPGGIGVMISSLLSGYLIDQVGLNGMTMVASAFMITGVLILLTEMIVRRSRRSPDETAQAGNQPPNLL